MEDENSLRERVDKFLDGLMFWVSILIALFISAAVLFAGGWIFQVPLGKLTTSEYVEMWKKPFLHPEGTALGKWAEDMTRRIKA